MDIVVGGSLCALYPLSVTLIILYCKHRPLFQNWPEYTHHCQDYVVKLVTSNRDDDVDDPAA